MRPANLGEEALLELPLRKDDAVGYREGKPALADGSADDSR
jgi:hypothetical protein